MSRRFGVIVFVLGDRVKGLLEGFRTERFVLSSAMAEHLKSLGATHWKWIEFDDRRELHWHGPCEHAGERSIDRATGDEQCLDCGELNP